MTTRTLSMLLGAACASAWWALSRWSSPFTDVLAIATSLGVIALLVVESIDAER